MVRFWLGPIIGSSFTVDLLLLDQWESRDRTLTTGVPFSQMIQFFPCEDKERLGFHLTVFEHCVPIFGDKNVIILMMLNLIFNDEKTEHLK